MGKQEDLRVGVEGGHLRLEGQSSLSTTTHKMYRLFKFPDNANLDMATATHEDGLLTFTVPIHAPAECSSIGIIKGTRMGTSRADVGPSKKDMMRDADHDPLMSACAVDVANVQLPDEAVDELEIEDANSEAEVTV